MAYDKNPTAYVAAARYLAAKTGIATGSVRRTDRHAHRTSSATQNLRPYIELVSRAHDYQQTSHLWRGRLGGGYGRTKRNASIFPLHETEERSGCRCKTVCSKREVRSRSARYRSLQHCEAEMPHHEALNIMLEAEVIRCLYDGLGYRKRRSPNHFRSIVHAWGKQIVFLIWLESDEHKIKRVQMILPVATVPFPSRQHEDTKVPRV